MPRIEEHVRQKIVHTFCTENGISYRQLAKRYNISDKSVKNIIVRQQMLDQGFTKKEQKKWCKGPEARIKGSRPFEHKQKPLGTRFGQKM